MLEIHGHIEAGSGDPAVKNQLVKKRGQGLFIHRPYRVDMRIALKHGQAFFFREHMDFRAGIPPRQKLQRRRGQEHIPNLPELADQDAAHGFRRHKKRRLRPARFRVGRPSRVKGCMHGLSSVKRNYACNSRTSSTILRQRSAMFSV